MYYPEIETMTTDEIPPVTVEEYKKLVEKDENDKYTMGKDEVGQIGERIVAGLMRTARNTLIHTDVSNGQLEEYDYILPWPSSEGKEWRQKHEVKCDREIQKHKRLFIEEVQKLPQSWVERGIGELWIPTQEEKENVNAVYENEHRKPYRAIGAFTIMRQYRQDHEVPKGKVGRFTWWVAPVPYRPGVKVPIIGVPDFVLFKLVEDRANFRYSKAYVHGSWGERLRLNTLFHFDVFDENERSRCPLRNVKRDAQGRSITVIGGEGKKADGTPTGAYLYLWDVDKGEEGYTPFYMPEMEKGGGTAAAMRNLVKLITYEADQHMVHVVTKGYEDKELKTQNGDK